MSTQFVLQNPNSGVGTAWFMATLGSKSNYRRVYRKDVANVSIPATCQIVASAEDSKMSLRLSSNLLYGISLIYKQKVGYMFDDVSTMYARLSRQISFDTFEPPTVFAKQLIVRKQLFLADDRGFDIENDFNLDWNDDEVSQRILEIREHDNFLNFVTDSVPLTQRAEERDRLFGEYMDKTMISFHFDAADEEEVDFEFDNNGEIVGKNIDNEPNPFLDINFDEEIRAVTTVVDDFSKTDNTNDPHYSTNDPHYSTVLNQSRAVAVAAKKKRRFKVSPDGKLVLSASQLLEFNHKNRVANCCSQVEAEMHISKKPRFASLSETVTFMSSKNPPFLNLCLRTAFGIANTSSIHRSNFPLASRHIGVSEDMLDSYLKDIEQGRNIQPSTLRKSLEREDFYWNDDYDDPFVSFGDLENIVEDPEVDFALSQSSVSDSPNARRAIEKFHKFIKARSTRFGIPYTADAPRETSEQLRMITFEALIPSKQTPTEQPVERKLAATSFASILELVSRSLICIQVNDFAELAPVNASSIEIILGTD